MKFFIYLFSHSYEGDVLYTVRVYLQALLNISKVNIMTEMTYHCTSARLLWDLFTYYIYEWNLKPRSVLST